jgi:hypothetical protein
MADRFHWIFHQRRHGSQRDLAPLTEQQPRGAQPPVIRIGELGAQAGDPDGPRELAECFPLRSEGRRIEGRHLGQELVELTVRQPPACPDEVSEACQGRLLSQGPRSLPDQRGEESDAHAALAGRKAHRCRANGVDGIEEAPLDQSDWEG